MKLSFVICQTAALIGSAAAFTVVAPRFAPTKCTSTSLNAFEPENAGILAQSTTAIAAGGAAVVAGLAAIFSNLKGGSKKENAAKTLEKEVEGLPPVDVSIPYNAAALLAFDEFKGDKIFPDDTFAKFEPIYNEKVVAVVKSKKVQRELKDALEKADEELGKLATLGE